MKLLSALLGLTLCASVLAGCDTESDPVEPLTTVQLTATGLGPLGDGAFYEGWAVIRNLPSSFGKFNVNANGGLTNTSGQTLPGGLFVTELDLNNATRVFITIEPKGDTNDRPAPTVVLAGTVSGTQTALSATSPDALGLDFADAAGLYTLATFTNDDPTDERSGLWFVDPSGPALTAGLSLPVLPAGWKYEGWARIGSTPVSTGTFLRPDFRDDANPFGASNEGPSFPGEDFLNDAPFGLTFPADLAGGRAFITLEPDPDGAPDVPFVLTLLSADIPATATGRTVRTLTNTAAASLPTGIASFQ